MTDPVRSTSPADKAWADLAAQLTPSASMSRIDTVTARAISTTTIIGLLLTGVGALSANQLSKGSSAATNLAVAAALTATLAVACALTAQVLTITRHINPANLKEVKTWYYRHFTIRAYATCAATILLILAALLSGTTAAVALLTTSTPNTVAPTLHGILPTSPTRLHTPASESPPTSTTSRDAGTSTP